MVELSVRNKLAILAALIFVVSVPAFAGHGHGHDCDDRDEKCGPCQPVTVKCKEETDEIVVHVEHCPDLVRCRKRRDGTLVCPPHPRRVLHAVP